MTILYEGCIKEIDDGVATVSLIELATDDEYYAEIDLDKFPAEDRSHCAPGSLFTISEGPQVALRRDTWTQEDLDRITAEAKRKWREFQRIVA